MSRLVVFALTLCLFALTAWSADRPGTFQEKAPSPSILEELRRGGYVLYLRHGRTDASRPDQFPIDLDDCSTQRPLTEAGREEIRAIGEYIRRAGIPVGEVLTSPLCRAVESAKLAFGPSFEVNRNLMYTAHLTSAEKVSIVAETRRLVSSPPTDTKKNRMIVAHAPNLADLMDYYPEVEGTLVVFRPLGEQRFTYVASVLPHQWRGLLE